MSEPVIPEWETLLRTSLGENAVLTQASAAFSPFPVPFAQLASRSGWVVWLGHPPVPDGLPLLPAPPHLLWDSPVVTLAAVAGLSLEYAGKRGADEADAVSNLLGREAPVAVVVPDEAHESVDPALNEIRGLGLHVILGPDDLADRLTRVPSFAARAQAHAVSIARPHDPALAFQTVEVVDQIGGNPLSSFVLHHEGERDGVSVLGELGARVGIEIGVRGPSIDIGATEALERDAATMPGFLDGVTSRPAGHSLEIGWQDGGRPTAIEIGEAIRTWLKALYRLPLVDVRLAFAPPHGRSALLADMRSRAAAFKAIRGVGSSQSAVGSR